MDQISMREWVLLVVSIGLAATLASSKMRDAKKRSEASEPKEQKKQIPDLKKSAPPLRERFGKGAKSFMDRLDSIPLMYEESPDEGLINDTQKGRPAKKVKVKQKGPNGDVVGPVSRKKIQSRKKR
jgi:hypothetical protein